jgi:hypothetical protein
VSRKRRSKGLFQIKGVFKRERKSSWACWWLTPLILATQEAEIRGITVLSQPRQLVCKTLPQKKKKNPSQKRAGRVAQV